MNDYQSCMTAKSSFVGAPSKRIFAVVAIAIALCCAIASINGFVQSAYADQISTKLVAAEAYEVAAETGDYSTYDDYYYDDYYYDEDSYYTWPLYFDYSLTEPVGVQQGKHLKLKRYLMETEGKTLVWTSSKKKIATVNSKGVVTGKKPGTTTIKVKNKDDSSDYAKIKVSVYKKPVKSKVYKQIMKLKSKYPEGKVWGNEKTYFWKKANLYCYACIALSGRISDTVFGKAAPLKVHHKYNKIKVGDHICIGGSHSVIVLTKDKRGVRVVEGNYNGRVHWGRYIKRSELKSAGFAVWTRY